MTPDIPAAFYEPGQAERIAEAFRAWIYRFDSCIHLMPPDARSRIEAQAEKIFGPLENDPTEEVIREALRFAIKWIEFDMRNGSYVRKARFLELYRELIRIVDHGEGTPDALIAAVEAMTEPPENLVSMDALIAMSQRAIEVLGRFR